MRTMFSLMILCLTACGGMDGMGGTAGPPGPQGPAGAPGMTGAMGAMGLDGAAAMQGRSGARLHLRQATIVGGDGSYLTMIVGYTDTLYNDPCQFFTATDGKFRCQPQGSTVFPLNFNAILTYFSDATCKNQLYGLSNIDLRPDPSFIASADPGQPGRFWQPTIYGATQPHYFAPGDGSCKQLTNAQVTTLRITYPRFFSFLTSEVTVDKFQAGQVVENTL